MKLCPSDLSGHHDWVDGECAQCGEPDEMGDCPECGNSGFSSAGTGYDDVCSFCCATSVDDGLPVRLGGIPRQPRLAVGWVA